MSHSDETSSHVPKEVPLLFVDKFPIAIKNGEKEWREALNLIPRSGDTVVATYPKCGTTWTQYIVWCLMNPGFETLPKVSEMRSICPFVERAGTAGIMGVPESQKRFYKTHVTFQQLQRHPEGRYVAVLRNPWDCAVSFYNFAKNNPAIGFINGKWDDFIRCYINGKVPYGDCIEHMKEYFAHRNDPNLLVLTYEQLQSKTKECIKTIGIFLRTGQKDGNFNEIVNDEEADKIALATNFNNMKEYMNTDQPGPLPGLTYFRKGIVGDWVNMFTPEQKSQADQWYKKALKDCPELYNMWSHMLS